MSMCEGNQLFTTIVRLGTQAQETRCQAVTPNLLQGWHACQIVCSKSVPRHRKMFLLLNLSSLSMFGRSFPSENMPFTIPWLVIHPGTCLVFSSRQTQWQISSYSFAQLSSLSNASFHNPITSRSVSGRPCGAHPASILPLHHL